MRERRCPAGNLLLDRMHHKNGAYYRVVKRSGKVTWSRLGDDYSKALRAWSKLEGLDDVAVRTVSQAVSAYLVDRGEELADKTLVGYENSALRLNEVFGPCYLGEVERRDVRAWLHARSAPVSANRDLALLRAAYNHAGECGYCDDNPAAGIRRRKESPRRRIASQAERAALARVMPPLWRAMLAVFVLTAMRAGELRTLKRSELTDDGIELYRPKTGAESLIKWSPALRSAINEALAAQELPTIYVFPSGKHKPYAADAFSRMFARYCERAGVDGLQMRDMRRTGADAAESLAAAQALLGHSSPEITKRVYRPRDIVEPTG